MEIIIMKKKAYKKPTMTVYDLPNFKLLQVTSDPDNVPKWNRDFG